MEEIDVFGAPLFKTFILSFSVSKSAELPFLRYAFRKKRRNHLLCRIGGRRYSRLAQQISEFGERDVIHSLEDIEQFCKNSNLSKKFLS